MFAQEFTERLKAEASRLGFDKVGIAPAIVAPGYPEFLRWLNAGYSAGMDYLQRQEPTRSDPSLLLEGVRSIVVVSVVYGSNESSNRSTRTSPRQGKIARYARGADYHRVLWERLERLLEWMKQTHPEIRGRAVADTAPLLERDYARLAGLGWIGKNTMLISRKLGSFTFLGALLTDLELAYDSPHLTNHCGTCTRCLEACPTGALPEAYQLDARQCISYWTIEHRGPLSESESENLNGWVFGCDICQDVCPWNRKAPSGRLEEFQARPEWDSPDLLDWLRDDTHTWQGRLKGTALKRTKRVGLLRNAILVLGSRRLVEAVVPLSTKLDDVREDATVRAAAAWALGRIATDDALLSLDRHLAESDPVVRESVLNARAMCVRLRVQAGGSGSLES